MRFSTNLIIPNSLTHLSVGSYKGKHAPISDYNHETTARIGTHTMTCFLAIQVKNGCFPLHRRISLTL